MNKYWMLNDILVRFNKIENYNETKPADARPDTRNIVRYISDLHILKCYNKNSKISEDRTKILRYNNKEFKERILVIIKDIYEFESDEEALLYFEVMKNE